MNHPKKQHFLKVSHYLCCVEISVLINSNCLSQSQGATFAVKVLEGLGLNNLQDHLVLYSLSHYGIFCRSFESQSHQTFLPLK